MKASEMTQEMLLAMHRAPALRQPGAPAKPPATPVEAVASVPKKKAYDHHPDTQLPDTKPQRDKAPALGGAAPGKEKGVSRARVRFTGYRVRPLDPDNFAGSVKDLLDGCRHAGLIIGDEPWNIILETEQVKVGSYAEEKTVIEVTSQ